LKTFVGFDSEWPDNPCVPGAITIARFNNGLLAEWGQPRLVAFRAANLAPISTNDLVGCLGYADNGGKL